MTDTSKTPAISSKKEKSYAITVRALEKIDQVGLPSSPQFYELWYRYFDGDPEIVRAINTHQGPLDEAACQKIYARFVAAGQNDGAVRKVSDQVQTSIVELVGMLKSATSATQQYNDSLGGVSESLEKAGSIEDLGSVISDIVQETRKMLTKNHELEEHLASSATKVTELKQYLETVKKEASTDSLTGIANRKAFDKRLMDSIEESITGKQPMVLMMIDIDFFKKFNDTYGHPAGDQILRLVARTLLSNVKGQDMAARYGGEEFAIILPATPLSAGLRVAEVLRKAVESKEVTNKVSNERLGSISISVGVAEYVVGESSEDLITRADTALYEAKRTGRNKVCKAG